MARILSLDVFRGLTIALMIVVNSPGNTSAYSLLEHSVWNGCTFADLVFPFFIFILGVSSVLMLATLQERHTGLNILMYRIINRTALLFALGLFLNAFPYHFYWENLRCLGVLQRLAICYFFSSTLYLFCTLRTQIIISALILILYWALMTFIPVPEFGVNHLTPAGNLAAYLDRLILSPPHLYTPLYDPEGLLSTLPSIATALLGNTVGIGLLKRKTDTHFLYFLGFWGSILALSGWTLGLFIPINKALWSSTFVLWTAGLAFIFFACCYWLIEVKQWRRWCRFFEIFGTNALAAYMLHVLLLKIQILSKVENSAGEWINVKQYSTQLLFGSFSAINASLFYALSFVFFCFGAIWVWMDLKQRVYKISDKRAHYK